MLIEFELSNWTSFGEPAKLSFVASRERRHSERVPRLKAVNKKILPACAIYGANASGKSNLVNGIEFAQELITGGRPIYGIVSRKPFKLNSQHKKKESCFRFIISNENKVFEYKFCILEEKIFKESLSEIKGENSTIIFKRENSNIELSDKYSTDFNKFAAEGTRDNTLFLTNNVSQNGKDFKAVYDWFHKKLNIIKPESRYLGITQHSEEDREFLDDIGKALSSLDTGIYKLDFEELSKQEIELLEIEDVVDRIIAENPSAKILTLLGSGAEKRGQRLVIEIKDGETSCYKLFAYHMGSEGKRVKFEFSEESDGTIRLLDLLPAFLERQTPDHEKVTIIDELDRSLHTLACRQLIDTYLKSCSETSRSQLVFTTHDAMLLDQDIFRRDEMWLVEKTLQGMSQLFSISDFEGVRHDTDVRKHYLLGRFGGTPRFMMGGI